MKKQQILENLQGTMCFCGKSKGTRKSHCSKCYYKLPPEMRKALYQKFFEGYEEAFVESLKFLGTYPQTENLTK